MQTGLLVFIDWFPPGFRAGGPVTSNVNLSRHLRERIDIRILTSDTEYCETEPYAGIAPDCWGERDGIQVCYLEKARIGFRKMLTAIRSAKCDVWYINGAFSRYFSIYPLILAKIMRPRRVVVAPRGMFSPHSFTTRGLRKKCFISIFRRLGFYRNVIFHATSEEEAKHIRILMGPRAQVREIKNLPPFASRESQGCRNEKHPGSLRLISIARISPEKNTLFALQGLQACRSRVTYEMYGQIYDRDYWKRCQALIAQLPENVRVEYRGVLRPEEIAGHLAAADFLYLPSRGENFGHAILESLLNSVPVIISDRTPWRDLVEAGVGWDLPIDAPERFSAVIDQCAEMSLPEYRQLSGRCRTYLDGELKLNDVVESYCRLFHSESRDSKHEINQELI